MRAITIDRKTAVGKAAESEGYASVEDMLKAAMFDSMCPGVCINCEFVCSEIEPDHDRGCCENCGGNFVVSVLVLEGIM